MRNIVKVLGALAIALILVMQGPNTYAVRRQGPRNEPPYLTPMGPTITVTSAGASVGLGWSTGTVTVSASDSTIVGAGGTDWQTEETATRIGVGMSLIVNGDYRYPLLITDITDGTHIEISGFPPEHLAGAGLSYVIGLTPNVDYILTTNANVYFLVGAVGVTAIDGASQYLGMNQSWAITPYWNKLFVAVIPVGGAGACVLRVTPCE